MSKKNAKSRVQVSQSMTALEETKSNDAESAVSKPNQENRMKMLMEKAHHKYNCGQYTEALEICEIIYENEAYKTENLLLLGALHFQLRNYSESIFYNQQCIKVDPNLAEAYSNLGNSLKELGDMKAAVQFYLKAIKMKPRFCDAYNNLASAYTQLGQITEAMETYHMALVLNPALADAHSNLGNLYKAQGNLESARKCYLEAIRIKPEFSIAWSNLGGVFKEEGQLATAASYFKEAVRLCPEFADAHSNLGNVHKEQGEVDEAIVCYKTAIKLRPDFAIAHGNLASCYYEKRYLSEAISSYKYAIQLEPNYPDAYNNLGNALRENNQIDQAIQMYRSALRLKPEHPHAYNNLGNALKDRGLIKEAVHCYVTAIRLHSKFSAAHSNLGSILKEQGKLEQALSHYQEAISIDPLFADAYSNMGNVYKELGRNEEAIKCYQTAIRITPGFADAYSNLAATLKDTGRPQEAIEHYRSALSLKPTMTEAFANLVHTLSFVCDWDNREDDFARLSQVVQEQLGDFDPAGAGSPGSVNSTASANSVQGTGLVPPLPAVQPFHALVYPFSMAEMQQIARRYAMRVKLNVSLTAEGAHYSHRPKPHSVRLKIGYVSSDFGNHPLSHLMGSLFGLHDTSRFEITCYALTASDHSDWRNKIESEVEHFKDISLLHPSDAAQLIHNDGIHVLVNLNGYTKGSRNEIFALKPAAVQVQFMGFCGTMGADYIQYMVADEVAVPQHYRQFYTEKMIYLPHSYFVNDHKQACRYIYDQSKVPTRAKYGLSEDKFVFCNFCQLYKIDPETFTVWMSILKRVPNSVLWLLRFPPVAEANIIKEAAKCGVREEQLHFTDVAPKEEHILRGFLADLFLDTAMCNAHTTACDILWSGTPMITLQGDKMAARVGSSVLHAAGLDDLICKDYAAYEELAVSLATDSEKLFSYRRHLENTRENSALFDTERWVRNLERGFLMAWKKHELSNLSNAMSAAFGGGGGGANAGMTPGVSQNASPNASMPNMKQVATSHHHHHHYGTEDYMHLMQHDDITVIDEEPVFTANSSVF